MSVPITCRICRKKVDSKVVRRHLNSEHSISIEEYYVKKIDKKSGFCRVCGEKTRFLRLSRGFAKYCSELCEGRDRILKLNKKYPGHQSRAGKRGYEKQKELHPDVVSRNIELVKTSAKRLPDLYKKLGDRFGPKNLSVFNSFRKQHDGCGPYEWMLWSDKRFRELRPKRQDYRFKSSHKIIMDFSLPSLQLCIEIDGRSHNLGYDSVRDATLRSLGWRVLHFTNKEVADNLDSVVERIYKEVGVTV